MNAPELSFVIPVYNGAATIGFVVQDILRLFQFLTFEIILVNDGSRDQTEAVCRQLVEAHPQHVTFLQLSRNFSEHNAVLAGLNQSRGAYVAVLDDDGQNPPAEIIRMYEAIKTGNFDTVYGFYREKQHHWFRNLGSRFNDAVATVMLKKPKHLYLSSFKVMNRFTVDQVITYRGAFPYIDGLIFRTTQNIAQIPVEHRKRDQGASGYTLKKLVKLWLNMFLNFSISPLRLAAMIGLFTAAASVPLMILIIIDKIMNPSLTMGVPTILVAMTFFSGIQLLIIGLVGEYLGRMFLDHSGTPQYIVRYAYGREQPEPGPMPRVPQAKRLTPPPLREEPFHVNV
ncbi:glycosyltransferase family 2 protein [Oligoflexus tunisiensis]|uniref:glycosyltransferase family 2 protein n=1 Tax=Oligoflexus tunisiensis TaxID=708132 RepID=UPI000B336221|nr:glycosyltransferase family 2 protein [Oligoflexus tunisiensis]